MIKAEVFENCDTLCENCIYTNIVMGSQELIEEQEVVIENVVINNFIETWWTKFKTSEEFYKNYFIRLTPIKDGGKL